MLPETAAERQALYAAGEASLSARKLLRLSGGEAQRIRLATQIGSGLSGVLYILDEPSIGLHPRDHARLMQTIKHLRDVGNSVLLVEHDEDSMRAADWLLDLGPGAGKHGGELVAEGTPEEVALVQGGAGDFNDTRVAAEVLRVGRAGKAHRRTQAASQLVQHAARRAL